MLVKWVGFLYTMHWPQGEADLGVDGVSYVELLILYQLWAGERLVLEKAVPQYRRAGRSISVSAGPSGPGTDIWCSCRVHWCPFEVALCSTWWYWSVYAFRYWSNHCWLRHIGWEKCRHGLTSRPRESASEGF